MDAMEDTGIKINPNTQFSKSGIVFLLQILSAGVSKIAI